MDSVPLTFSLPTPPCLQVTLGIMFVCGVFQILDHHLNDIRGTISVSRLSFSYALATIILKVWKGHDELADLADLDLCVAVIAGSMASVRPTSLIKGDTSLMAPQLRSGRLREHLSCASQISARRADPGAVESLEFTAEEAYDPRVALVDFFNISHVTGATSS